MPRRLAHFSDPRLDAQIGELIKKHKELQKDIEQLERRLQKPIGLPDAMPPTEHEHGVADITDFPEAMPPTAHKASHAGGSDAITPADIGAETPSGAQAKVDTHEAKVAPHSGHMILGTSNTDINKVKALKLQTDTRSLTLTYTSGNLTKVEEKNGATIVKTTNLTYTDGNLTKVTETVGNTTVTTTLTYTDGALTSVTKAVS
jgi:hypothetical protein